MKSKENAASDVDPSLAAAERVLCVAMRSSHIRKGSVAHCRNFGKCFSEKISLDRR